MSLCRHGGVDGRAATALSLLMATIACSPSAALDGGCQIVQPLTGLPAGLEESSGVAASRDHPGVLWTHNDSGGDAEVVGVRANGELVASVRVTGAAARDWEDAALAPCPSGTCLFLADTGDGDARRDEVGVYRIPEPDPASPGSPAAEHFPARYPGGPRDAEALFVLPGGELFLITKGQHGPVEIFRYPMPLRQGERVTLEPLRTLAPAGQPLEEQVTGASASPSGRWVAIRSYKRLRLWRTEELISGGEAPFLTVDLTPLGEVQGEAVALLDNGAVVLTSEGGFPGAVGTIAVLQCQLDEE